MSGSKTDLRPGARWMPPPRPEWVQRMNEEGAGMDLRAVVPLDEESLLAAAVRNTGLSDFGDGSWEEPFRVLLRSLEHEAELNLMGRLMVRSDLLIWLQSRLQVEESYRRHPEIDDEEVVEPLFIIGLPRSGTSILFELLSCDPAFGIPTTWESMFPCPPPEKGSYGGDDRLSRADWLVTQWARVVPQYATMHEMGGSIPAECGMIMAPSFISDHIQALYQTPAYDQLLMNLSWEPAYRYHQRVLKLLQWRNPRERWLLKAPNHMNHLPLLMQTYPDARIVQTHRDPLKCMASATSLLGAIYWMRSDKGFDSTAFEDVILGEATASRLERVMEQRDAGVVPPGQIVDSLYQGLMDDPLAAIDNIYRHLGLRLSEAGLGAMRGYLANKPQGKFGRHSYAVDPAIARERAYFRRYQSRYGVPDEC
jgi:hypothetical protein